jgi:C-terminal processing protease CtpA/Prc
MSALASLYLTQAVNIMQTNSINRLTIDWTAFRAEVFAAAPQAQAIADLDAAFSTALRLLGDGHSSYRSASGRFVFVPTRSCSGVGARSPTVHARIGYVRVTSFSGTAAQALTFASGIQSTIRTADHDSIAGWIVDLRGNGGGNMWPMVAGLGPIIGEDVVGWFIDPDGAEIPWEVREGGSYSGGGLAQRVDNPYQLRKVRPKVAVLVDNAVASSGEATFITFIKRPNTRSFGIGTCGLSTANRGFPLSDGALLNLTVSTMADRTKFKYGDRVMPDESITDAAQMEQRAIAWLLSGS